METYPSEYTPQMKAFRVNLERDGRNQHQARITVLLDEDNGKDIEVLSVKEDESMCDGLGGGTWDGSLLLMDLVQEWLTPRGAPSSTRTPYESSTSGMGANGSKQSSEARSGESNPYIVELGAGTGLLGIVANAVNQSVDVCVTDRYSDLLEENVRGVLCPFSYGNMKRGKDRYRSVAEAMRKQAFLGTVTASGDSSGDAKACAKTDEEEMKHGGAKSTTHNDASPKHKRNRQQRSPEGKDGDDKSGSPSEERPRKRSNSVAADAKDGSSSDTCSNGSGNGNLTFEELTWTVKDANPSGFKPAPTAEEIRILFTPLPGHTYANTARYPDLILGAEIAVLMKQQAPLVSTIDRLAGPQTMVLVTCDDFPAYPSRSKYERNLDKAFADRGFCKVVLSAGRVRWRTEEVSERGRAPSVDYSSSSSSSSTGSSYSGGEDKNATVLLPPAVKSVKCAYLEHVPVVQGMDGGDSGSGSGGEGMEATTHAKASRKRGSSSSSLPLDALLRAGALRTQIDDLSASFRRMPFSPHDNNATVAAAAATATERTATRFRSNSAANAPPPPGSELLNNDDLNVHHVNAYFRPSLLSSCARCHQQFFNNPRLFNNPRCGLFNPHLVCKYHPQNYHCGDGNGEDGYQAKFWDCCGSKEKDAEGCIDAVHVAY